MIYPVKLTFKDLVNVREPIVQYHMNWDSLIEEARHTGFRTRTEVQRTEIVEHVVAADREGAWRAVRALDQVRDNLVTGSRLVSIQVDEPLATGLAEFVRAKRRGKEHN